MHSEPPPHDPRGAASIIVSAEPLLVGVPEAGRMLGLSPKSIRRLIASDDC